MNTALRLVSLTTAVGVWGFAGAATFTVTTTADFGAGSLRDALKQSNGNGAPDTITFAAGLGGQKIVLTSPLPSLDEGRLTLNGDLNSDGVPDVALDGTVLTGNGLQVRSAGNTVRGLRIVRCGGAAVALDRPAAQNNRIVACFLGTDATGRAPLGNNHGVLITAGADGNTVGGTAATDRNVISGNHLAGVLIAGANGNRVLNSFIGVDAGGRSPLANGAGVIVSDSEDCRIGNASAAGRNVIAANEEQIGAFGSSTGDGASAVLPFESHGVFILRGLNHVVAGNLIGTNSAGDVPLSNVGGDVLVRNAVDVLVGGTNAGARNVIGERLVIEGSRAVTLQGNHVGLNAVGNALFGGFGGIELTRATECTVGGTSAGARNFVGQPEFGPPAVAVRGGSGNQVLGNSLGLNRAGTKALGGGVGVDVSGGARNTLVGNSTADSGNLIAGMRLSGVNVFDAPGTVVARNTIGALANGSPLPLPAGNSIAVQTSTGPVTIGGSTRALGNTIFVGAFRGGIAVNGPSSVQVLNNRIDCGIPTAVVDSSRGIAVGVLFGSSGGPRIVGNLIIGMSTGMEIVGAGTTPVVARNDFSRYSEAAITIQGDAQPNLGDLGNAATNDDGGNLFAHSFSTLDVQNLTDNPILAEGNNWSGETRAAQIATFIFDAADDPTRGPVDFSPIFGGLLPTSAGAGGTVQVSGLTVAPAARGAEIVFALSAAAEVQAEVLNLAGRPVAALSPVDGRAGLNRLAWSGLSAQGTAAPAGVYLIRVTARAPSGAESNALSRVHLVPHGP